MTATTSKSAIRPVVQAALDSCQDPIGMTCSQVASATGLDPYKVSQALFRMRNAGRIHNIGALHDVRYFSRAEDRDAATGLYAEHMAALRVERAARAAATRKSVADRYKDRKRELRGSKAPRKQIIRQAGPTILSLVLKAVGECQDPLGLSLDALMMCMPEVGKKTIFQVVQKLVNRQAVHTWGFRHLRRIFLTIEQRDAAAPELEARKREAQRVMHRAQGKKKYEAKCAAKVPKVKAPKSVVFAKPRHKQAAITLSQPKPLKANFRDQPAITPAHVKTQECPGYVPRTFAPPPTFKGELSLDWERKRGAA